MNASSCSSNISTGNLIKGKLEEKGISIAAFARMLHCSRAYVYKILSKNSIETDLLGRISSVLEHDFFADFSENIGEN